MSAITSAPVVLSSRARVAGSAVRAAAPARVAPARRVQVVCAAKKGAFVFSPFVVVAPPGARARYGRGIRPTPVAWVRPSRDARSSRCRGEIRARLWRLPRRLRRPRARAPRPPSSLQAPRLSNQHLTMFEFLPRAQAPSPLARSPSPPPDPRRPLSRISASRTSIRR